MECSETEGKVRCFGLILCYNLDWAQAKESTYHDS